VTRLLALLLLVSAPALAAEPVGPRLSTSSFALDVDLDVQRPVVPAPTDSQADLSVEERRAIQKRLKLRRKMVDAHTVLSFIAAGGIVATDIIGFGNLGAIEEAQPKRADLEPGLALHRSLALLSSASYLGAGITAWTMPRAYQLQQAQAPKTGKADSGDVHVVFSIIHGISMATVVATGLLQANAIPASESWEHVARIHLGAGLTAATFVIGGAIVIAAF
jgi:hypothetical protein